MTASDTFRGVFCWALLAAGFLLQPTVAQAEVRWNAKDIQLSIPASSVKVNIPRAMYDWKLVREELENGGLWYRFRSERNAFHLTLYITKHNCGTAWECMEFEWNMSSIFGPTARDVEKLVRGRYAILVYNIEHMEGGPGVVTFVKAYTLQDEVMISLSTDAISDQALDAEFFLALIDRIRIASLP